MMVPGELKRGAIGTPQHRAVARAMGAVITALWLLLVAPAPARSQPDCDTAIFTAERDAALPSGLLAAIAIRESGRPGPGGVLAPWPWTINAEGNGRFFATENEAIEAVQALEMRGVRSIDVGCLQVNLRHHAHAFASLAQAFDPAANAAYAARYLTALFAETGDWLAAAAAYHSRTPALGAPYRQAVLALWTGGWPQRRGRSVLQPFAPLPLAGAAEEGVGADALTRLIAATPNCVAAGPSAGAWALPMRAPGCGGSPFASVSSLRRALASAAAPSGEFPPPPKNGSSALQPPSFLPTIPNTNRW